MKSGKENISDALHVCVCAAWLSWGLFVCLQRSHYTAQVNLKHEGLLPWSPACWDHRHAPPCPTLSSDFFGLFLAYQVILKSEQCFMQLQTFLTPFPGTAHPRCHHGGCTADEGSCGWHYGDAEWSCQRSGAGGRHGGCHRRGHEQGRCKLAPRTLQPHPHLSHIPSLHALLWETDCQSRLRPANLLFPMAVANEQVASHIANILFFLHY